MCSTDSWKHRSKLSKESRVNEVDLGVMSIVVKPEAMARNTKGVSTEKRSQDKTLYIKKKRKKY